MTTQALDAWMALYGGCGVLATVAASAAIARVAFEIGAGRLRPTAAGWRGRLIFAPRLWLCWQISYLSATPVILLSLLMFASELGFDRLLAI